MAYITLNLGANLYVKVFTARAVLSAVFPFRRRHRRPKFTTELAALKRGDINGYLRTTVVVIYSAILGDH